MKHILLISAALAVFSAPLHASCYADYKAKRDDPLKLHYGVAQLTGACNIGSAQNELSARLANGNWVLIKVLSVFDEKGLQERKDSAGQFYLRF